MKVVSFTLTLLILTAAFSQAADKPNILLIHADDVGWGDFTAYNPNSKIHTPEIDQLAKTGIKFKYPCINNLSKATLSIPSKYDILLTCKTIL
ncbi:MAG: sulfatase-like hydrolase/transferase [Planctomycetaceae bacterium]|jgi:arylsulfatase A-like enzyme|nr:sulfatase-like hydrolase/transferase [Planctomycetaceae bacterium]